MFKNSFKDFFASNTHILIMHKNPIVIMHKFSINIVHKILIAKICIHYAKISHEENYAKIIYPNFMQTQIMLDG